MKKEKQRFMQLADIKQYTSIGFTIKGTINHRSPLETKTVFGLEKSFFFAVIIDHAGTEMKISFWADQAVDSYGKLKKGSRVWITGLAPKKAKFGYATHGDIELKSTKGLQIQIDDEDEDADDDILIIHSWNAPPSILKISEKPINTIIDAIGFVHSIEDVKQITTRKSKQTDLLNFDLVDQTARIRVSAWGQHAHTELSDGQLIGIKGARVSDYNGRSLTVTGYIEKEPQGTMCDSLNDWKQSTNPIIKALFKKIPNLSDKAAIGHDWNAAPTHSIPQIRQVQEKFRIRQSMPQISAVKVEAKIDDVHNSLWYSKADGLHWKVKLTLEDEQQNWFEAVGFDEVGKKFFNGLSADEAHTMQMEEEEKFIELIEGIKFRQSNKKHVFCIYAKENKWNSSRKYIDWIIEDVDPSV